MMRATALIAWGGCWLLGGVAYAHEHGYVLKRFEGEVLGPKRIIKASPKTGTQAAVMILDTLSPGFATGLHVHVNEDALFFVAKGRGTATIGDRTREIETGDTIFVPVGTDHEISVSDGPMELLFFLDKPGFDQLARDWYDEFSNKPPQDVMSAAQAAG